ncbi:DNA repair protein RadC [Motilimonas cestriensis]|uniref:DNA repair protein RadC n=1 Tax=Motilimonas cestriensis TaxID=2742685 RepID=A0ABS8W4T5_9GAMM|nr:DNA repair protein RadC [Motilimonas cestriensis]MCE2593986.1 DNA repair protein RadC [Motilimonas cestriensis]
MGIKQWPAAERPREKLLDKGAQALSDAELLAIFLRTGCAGLDAVQLARHLLNDFGSLRAILNAQQGEFCQGKGLGTAKYVQLQAVVEICRRYLAEKMLKEDALTSPQATRQYLTAKMRDYKNEVFAALLLDNQHRVLNFVELFHGSIDCAAVYPRAVVEQVLTANAAAIILVHNHPSGICEPSQADRRITERLIAALALIDVRVLDHLVVGDGETASFAERGWI